MSPNGQGDVYISQADLSESKPPPKDSFGDIASQPNVRRGVGLLYIVAVTIWWGEVAAFLRYVLPEFHLSDWLPPLVMRYLQFLPSAPAVWYGVVVMLPFLLLVLVHAILTQQRTGVDFYSDIVFLRNIAQVVFLLVIAITGFTLVDNLITNLAESGLRINFGVLGRNFGTEVSEGPDPRTELTFLDNVPLFGGQLERFSWLDADTNFRALTVGFINTLRVVWLSLVASTLLGVFVGVGLLSNNWLVKQVTGGYVEVFRNTPLLVQLFFIYNGVLKVLPSRPGDAIPLPGSIYISGRGLYYPALIQTETFPVFIILVLVGAAIGVFLWRRRIKINEQTGEPANGVWYFLGTLLGFGVAGLIFALIFGGTPLTVELPQRGNFNFEGGASLSAEYLGLFLGLTLYTSSFIADIVRAGIQSVPKGQVEAARALGLNNSQTLSRVILPQAMRLAIPPLTNQYLNLAKNSSLGIAIGFADVYNVATIAQNQTGQAVALFVVLMVTYLGMSLFISLVMNVFNSSLKLRTR